MVPLHPPPSFEAAPLAPQNKKQHYDKDYLQELQPPRTRPENVSKLPQGQATAVLDARYIRSAPHRQQGVLHLCHVSRLRHIMLTTGTLAPCFRWAAPHGICGEAFRPTAGPGCASLQQWVHVVGVVCTCGDAAASAADCIPQAHLVCFRRCSTLQTCCDSARRFAISKSSDLLQAVTYTADLVPL